MKDLTSRQKDYAVFLPAISSFYATYIGKQRSDPNYIPSTRIPTAFTKGVEELNFLEPEAGSFYYKYALYSAGHADLDLTKDVPREDWIRQRPRDGSSLLVGDSGGFQIGKGRWEGDWKDPNCPKAQKKRDLVLKWMDGLMDYGMVLDIPAWVVRDVDVANKVGILTYEDACKATIINNEYFMKHSTGACKFLNVLQGENHQEADDWYARMKDYCDPKVYPETHFRGWSMGGQNMCDVHLLLKRLVHIRHDGLLEKGKHDWMHFLGTSKLEWATLLTDVQRAVRKYHNENFTISFDCASPFLATANGQLYITTETADRTKWVYRMVPSVDDKKYATDTRKFKDAVVADGVFSTFTDSPLSDKMLVKDVCVYAPGDLNKIGKEGKTSWDSFSYALQMGHNVWSHIDAVQTANEQYDKGIIPGMLVDERFDSVYFKDVVEAIFATDNKDESLMIIEEYNKLWQSIIGTRGAVGKKTVNAGTMFNNLFEEV
tara:strand:- start:304 stop:1767 length:1464 start_codon:yes stop_codon:yes gene_type:complete